MQESYQVTVDPMQSIGDVCRYMVWCVRVMQYIHCIFLQIKATLEGLTGVRADRQVLLGDRVHVSHDQVCVRLRTGSIQQWAHVPLHYQQTLASAGVARGTTLVMAEREPDVQAPHANMFGALRPEVYIIRVFATGHLRPKADAPLCMLDTGGL